MVFVFMALSQSQSGILWWSVPGRYDYEDVGIDTAVDLMLDLEVIISDRTFVGQTFTLGGETYEVEKADNFEYNDPVDGSITKNQVMPFCVPLLCETPHKIILIF